MKYSMFLFWKIWAIKLKKNIPKLWNENINSKTSSPRIGKHIFKLKKKNTAVRMKLKLMNY
jgi:hypothetical protein